LKRPQSSESPDDDLEVLLLLLLLLLPRALRVAGHEEAVLQVMKLARVGEEMAVAACREA